LKSLATLSISTVFASPKARWVERQDAPGATTQSSEASNAMVRPETCVTKGCPPDFFPRDSNVSGTFPYAATLIPSGIPGKEGVCQRSLNIPVNPAYLGTTAVHPG